ARQISGRLGLRYVEIDGLFHGPNWTPRSSFEQDVRDFADHDAWVIEWQYRAARPLLAARAELLLFLDYPRAMVMRRVIARTVRRRIRRTRLWNGNVEPPLRTIFSDPEHVIRWAWSSHARTRESVLELARARPELPIVRVVDQRQTDAWMRRICGSVGG
ncbi:MAG: AAA family ATPase, partial [Kofleriaceae bacterium]